MQQDEADQEEEFQRAFTLELILSALFSVVILISAPILVAVYNDDRLLLLTMALSYLPIAFALQAPLWIFFRRMDFVAPAGAAGAPAGGGVRGDACRWRSRAFGVWSLVIGRLAGNAASVVSRPASRPTGSALRFDREATRRYMPSRGWCWWSPLRHGVDQGQVLAFEADGGLAGGRLHHAGADAHALRRPRRPDRTATIYPAICAIRGRQHDARGAVRRSPTARRCCLGAPFWPGCRAVRARPRRVRSRRRVGAATVLLQGLAVGGLLAAPGLQLVRVLPRARRPAAAGDRGA